MDRSAPCTFIDPQKIAATLSACHCGGDAVAVREILAKALQLKGLTPAEVATLMNVQDGGLLEEVFAAARCVKERIYGPRLVIFAPLYISNLCGNECLYCAFRAANRSVVRRALSQEEIAGEVGALIQQGHKRLLMVAGEAYPSASGFQYILDAIQTIYATRSTGGGRGEIRRVNVNLAPCSVDQYRQLKAANIGTYQLFQETYHRDTYARMHLAGPKRDYDYRVTALDRAMQGGIDDVGMGVLYGLADWKFDTLAMLQHVQHLEQTFGCGPHTISVPRIEPAVGSDFASRPQCAVSDGDFLKLVAILRLAVPYTGLIMSTRESPAIRRQTFALGISQISAGSRTDPGGYAASQNGAQQLAPAAQAAQVAQAAQFQLGDHRSLDEVIADLAELGYLPSFCTACYRLGRTGRDFMDLAKPGAIRNHCGPNALSSFLEYLIDYASPATQEAGQGLIAAKLAEMEDAPRRVAERLLSQIRDQKRDVYV